MLLQLIALLAAVPAEAAVTQLAKTPPCRFVSPSAELVEQNHIQIAQAKSLDTRFGKRDEEFHVDVYFHVVAKSAKVEDGYVAKEKVDEVMEILNDIYSTTPFRYTLQDVDWTINTEWEPDYENVKDYEMKKTLRKGDYRSLNVYIMKDWPGGYSSFPTNVTNGDRDFIEDGIVIGPEALKGSNHPVYPEGKTLAHEAGHWNGLFHTFEGECTEPGDHVDDTPAMTYPRLTLDNLCPVGRDSCPDMPGLDPIHNHMDYTSDACKSEFTPGQVTRMIDHWKTFRQNWK